MTKHYSFKQQTLRCAVCRTNNHNQIPQQIPRERLVCEFKIATEHGLAMDFISFEKAINDDYEPSDWQLESALSALGWIYTGWNTKH